MKKRSVIAFFSVMLVLALFGVVIAHEEGENEQEIEGYHFSLVTIPEAPVAGEPVTLQVHVKDEQENPVAEDTVEVEILRVKYPVKLVEPGVYELVYTFERFGHNEIYVNLSGRTAVFGVDVEVPETTNNYGMITLVLVALLIVGLGFAVAAKKLKVRSALLYGTILLIIIGLGYSVFAYKSSPAVQGCMLQLGDKFVLHCHQYVYVNICGESKSFRWEAGILERAHTHKDSHKFHWHPPEPVSDPAALMTLRNMFKDAGLELTETSIEDPETGNIYRVGEDECGTGTGGVLRVYSTSKNSDARTELEDFLDAPLEDEARIDIEYT
jgi:hypothetical protein